MTWLRGINKFLCTLYNVRKKHIDIACFAISALGLGLHIAEIMRLSEALCLSMLIMTAAITVFCISASLSKVGLIVVSFLLLGKFAIRTHVPFLSAVVAISLEHLTFVSLIQKVC